MPVYFCHGIPGSPLDAALLQPLSAGGALIAPDLFACDVGQASIQFDELTANMTEPITLVGFSLGAKYALTIAAERPERVARVVLISPAAPLELGDFLPQMAGRPVFQMARKWPRLFVPFSRMQGVVANHWPDLMVRALFAKSTKTEKRFADTPPLRNALPHGLRHSLGNNNARYRAAITSYVMPWATTLTRVQCEVEIWQGDADTWAPQTMAKALAKALPGTPRIHLLSAIGHYGALGQARL